MQSFPPFLLCLGLGLSTAVTSVNQYRQTAMIAGLATLLSITILQVGFAMMNLFCVDFLKPDRCCLGTILQGTLSALFLLVLLVAFILGGALFGISTLTADLCNNPAKQVHLFTRLVGKMVTCS